MANWHIQLHPNDLEGWKKEDIKNIVLKTGYIGIGDWDEGENQISQFKSNVQIGDYFVIRHKGPVGLVKIIGGFEEVAKDKVNWDLDWFSFRRKVELIEWFDVDVEKEIGFTIDAIFQPTTLGKTYTSIFINNWVNRAKRIMEESQNKEIRDLLEYKNQIILQGPPGTGKTRLAEELAEILITPKKLGTPIDKIDGFLKSFDDTDGAVIHRRDKLNAIKNEFYQKYPRESLSQLTLEDYAFGDGANESFCWWIEYNLFDFGGYSGFAQKFLIFWKKGINDYAKHGFVKNIDDDHEAMNLLAEQIFNIANEINLGDAIRKIGNGFLLKILNTYHPEKYFPINSDLGLTNGLKLLGVNPEGLSLIAKSERLQEEFNKRKSLNNSSANNIEFMMFLYQNFDMKGNIRIENAEILSSGESKTLIFHPSYTYEDFVRGISIQTNSNNQAVYIEQNKILAEFAKKANDSPSAKYVLILDEINRANLSSVLGELIYALEYRGKVVTSMYKDEIDNSNDLVLPKNLYIIGTMNTADRSVGHIDYAIRRRFAFVSILPKKLDETSNIWFNTSAYESVEKLFSKTYVTSDFDAKDVQIGHSYFIVKKEDAPLQENRDAFFKMKMKYEVIPILNEYLKDGILKSEAGKEIAIIESSFA